MDPYIQWNLKAGFPTDKQIWFLCMGLGLFTFLTRLIFPMGWKLDPLGFQLGDFQQYIPMFIAGTIAYRNHWLDSLDFWQGKKMGHAADSSQKRPRPALFTDTRSRSIISIDIRVYSTAPVNLWNKGIIVHNCFGSINAHVYKTTIYGYIFPSPRESL